MTQPSATCSNFKVCSQSYVFDPRPYLPLRISAKRYWTCLDPERHASAKTKMNSEENRMRGNSLTLVFAHAIGFHKEHWEPVIFRLFEQQQVPGQRSFQIQDIWAIDAPNHGDAAVMNEEVLAWGYTTFSSEDYARSIHAFLAGLGNGVDIDFSKRNLVGIGHSFGATAVTLSTSFYPLITFSSIHLIEPVFLVNYAENNLGSSFVSGAEKRRDIWESADHAYKTLKDRSPWRKWDDRVLRVYVEHGLRSLPTLDYPNRMGGVTLKCTKKQEAACFRDTRSLCVAYKFLPHVIKKIPTHITFGEIVDFIPTVGHHDVLHNASGGIANFASVTSVPGAGHLVVQTHPNMVANIIWKSLLKTHSSGQICDRTAVTAKL